MTTETNEERVRKIIADRKSGYPLLNKDFDWFIQQAERAQELEELNISLSEESRGNFQAASKYKRENACLREALEEIKFQTTFVETSDNVLEAIEQALKGE
ncbi:hypothetical protein [Sporosarcina sp. FSL K6-3508]|uniref:hypothetical protein n=1 Tax=Sporosarcina sp. FSL K6-3508 TaxID=2921557 RepID=UPI00315A4E8C